MPEILQKSLSSKVVTRAGKTYDFEILEKSF